MGPRANLHASKKRKTTCSCGIEILNHPANSLVTISYMLRTSNLTDVYFMPTSKWHYYIEIFKNICFCPVKKM
jgi:hypothetical protein